MATLQANKKAMRKAIGAVLRALAPSDVHTQSEQVVARVVAAPFFQRSSRVSCYLSMPSGELDTSALVAEIIRSGKTLFVPKIDPVEGKMDFVQVHGEDDLSTFPAGLWGIREPDYVWKDQPRKRALDSSGGGLDLVLLPGVAFDRSLSRLGHGKGYYDRFLAAYAAAHGGRKPMLVGLALREQVLESGKVPTGEWDWRMDTVVGPDGIVGGDNAIDSQVQVGT